LPASPVELLHAWRDYYVAIGGAAAALLGAMFVAASVGIGYFTRDHVAAIRSFMTPTVIHFAAVIFGSAFTMVPVLRWSWFGAMLIAAAVMGLAYTGFVATDVARRRNLEWVDHIWYAAMPVAGYLIVVAAGISAIIGKPGSVELLALAMVVLMIAGIRNAWDMIVFLVMQDRAKP
jgi:hypothetical protein